MKIATSNAKIHCDKARSFSAQWNFGFFSYSVHVKKHSAQHRKLFAFDSLFETDVGRFTVFSFQSLLQTIVSSVRSQSLDVPDVLK